MPAGAQEDVGESPAAQSEPAEANPQDEPEKDGAFVVQIDTGDFGEIDDADGFDEFGGEEDAFPEYIAPETENEEAKQEEGDFDDGFDDGFDSFDSFDLPDNTADDERIASADTVVMEKTVSDAPAADEPSKINEENVFDDFASFDEDESFSSETTEEAKDAEFFDEDLPGAEPEEAQADLPAQEEALPETFAKPAADRGKKARKRKKHR